MGLSNFTKKTEDVYSPIELAREELDAARGFVIPVTAEATILARGGNVPETYAEEAYAERAAEQPFQYAAEGITAARESAVKAAELKAQAEAADKITLGSGQLYDTAVAVLNGLLLVFAAHRMRTPKAKHAYHVRTLLLWLGDVVGIAAAAILLGEVPVLAVLMSFSAATATVTAGLVGKELKWIRERLRRQCDESALTEAQKPFAHLFRGPDKGERVAYRMVVASGFIGGLVACSIFALRASVDSVMAGATFGALAASVAIASAVSSYFAADELSDLIESAEADVKHYADMLKTEAASDSVRDHRINQTRADSITAEYDQRGQAAVHTVGVAKATMLTANPQVVGHGRPAEPPLAPVGRLHVKGAD